MSKKFIVSDDSVLNDRGFRVLTAGIKTDQFIKNPVGLFMHKRADRWSIDKDSILPICQWPDIAVEGNQLVGTPVFDANDEFAVQIESKVDGGFIRMASIGIIPITTSSDPKYLLPGQKYETVVECLLVEVSVVDIASNPNAIALYDADSKIINLSSGSENNLIPLISIPETPKTQNPKSMKKIAIQLGMKEDSTEDEIVEAVKKEQQTKTTLSTEVEAIRLSSIATEVDKAVADKKFAADKREHFINLGKSAGIETLKSTIELMNPAVKPTDFIKNDGGSTSQSGTITLAGIAAKGVNALETFKAENPEEYKQLYKAEYGVEL